MDRVKSPVVDGEWSKFRPDSKKVINQEVPGDHDIWF